MGEVFLARAEGPAGFAKQVVVKRILRHLADEPSFVEMFLNEARLAALLSHPNVVQIFELGEAGGTYFIVMEYVRGLSLLTLQKELHRAGKTLDTNAVAYIGAQALQGLHHAHTLLDAAGKPAAIIHRDVTPDNLLLGADGSVKVADFGIAKAASSVTTTGSGTLKGKLAYLSPEQINGKAVDPRTDVYAMGVCLYGALSGQLPFEGPSEGATLNAVLNHEAKDLAALRTDLPRELAQVIHRAISKRPEDRFGSALEMASALEARLSWSGKVLGQASLGAYLKEVVPERVGPNPDAFEPPASTQQATPDDEKPTRLLRGSSGVKAMDAEDPPPSTARSKVSAPSVIPEPPPGMPAEAVLLARVERAPVPDSDKRTTVPLTNRTDAFRPLMSLSVSKDFEKEFTDALHRSEYSPMEANRAVDFLCSRCLTQMDMHSARRWAGRGFLMRYRESILGRVLLAAMPFLGVERLVQRSPREFSATTNYGTRTVYRVADGHCRYTFEDEVIQWEFIEGILIAGGELSRAPGLVLHTEPQNTHAFTIDIRWNTSKA